MPITTVDPTTAQTTKTTKTILKSALPRNSHIVPYPIIHLNAGPVDLIWAQIPLWRVGYWLLKHTPSWDRLGEKACALSEERRKGRIYGWKWPNHSLTHPFPAFSHPPICCKGSPRQYSRWWQHLCLSLQNTPMALKIVRHNYSCISKKNWIHIKIEVTIFEYDDSGSGTEFQQTLPCIYGH